MPAGIAFIIITNCGKHSYCSELLILRLPVRRLRNRPIMLGGLPDRRPSGSGYSTSIRDCRRDGLWNWLNMIVWDYQNTVSAVAATRSFWDCRNIVSAVTATPLCEIAGPSFWDRCNITISTAPSSPGVAPAWRNHVFCRSTSSLLYTGLEKMR